jgi:hypothetical protein
MANFEMRGNPMKTMQRGVRFAALAAFLTLVGVSFSWSVAPVQAEGKDKKCPRQVLLIRHAEKTGEKSDVHLSKKGKERADVLYQLFLASRDRANPFPTPDFIFAASNKKDSHRPLETVEPLALKLKLSINNAFDSKLPSALKNDDKTTKAEGMLGLRDEIFSEPKYIGKTILISWRHSTISELAKTLRATKVPQKWEDDVFDRVWQINYDDQGVATFADRPQRLLPGDAEK